VQLVLSAGRDDIHRRGNVFVECCTSYLLQMDVVLHIYERRSIDIKL
jgi:hypothetical protein